MFASVLFKYKECYDGFLKRLAIGGHEAKALANQVPVAKIDEIRNIAQHVFDKDGKMHSPEKVRSALLAIDRAFPEMFGDCTKDLLAKFEHFRERLEEKYPGVREKVDEKLAAYELNLP